MIRLILLIDFTESFSYQLLKGILAYSSNHSPWVISLKRETVIRMKYTFLKKNDTPERNKI